MSWAALAKKAEKTKPTPTVAATTNRTAAAGGAPATAVAATAGGDASSNGSSSPPGSQARKVPKALERLAKCQKLVGYHVQMKVLVNKGFKETKTLSGIVYAAYDSMLVLQESSGLRLISIVSIANQPVILPEADGSDGVKKIRDLEIVTEVDERARQGMQQKFEAARAKRLHMLKNRNADATKLAQRIFDDLQKTFECSWHGTTICITNLGNLKIPAPYTADVVTGTQARAVERVKNIVQQMHDSRDAAAPEATSAPAAAAATTTTQ